MAQRRFSEIEEQEIARCYNTRLPDGTWPGAKWIAQMYNVATPTVYSIVHRQGFPTRSPSEAHAYGKRCKPIKNVPKGSTPLCKCGCGKLVMWNRRKNHWNLYCQGHYRPKQPYHDREWIEREYFQEHRTLTDIASEFGVCKGTIKKVFKKYGIVPRSQAESLKLTGAVRREKNPAWRGGIARLYTKNWKTISRTIRQRDEWTCQLCGLSKKQLRNDLHVHHIDYDKANNCPANLISLCFTCHRSIPEGDTEWQIRLARLARVAS